MKNTFGLDIGSSRIKAVWLEGSRDRLSLKSSITFPTPQKGMFSESAFDQEEMAQTIRTVVKDAKIGTRLVNVSLPENHVFTKIIEMPALSEKDLQSAIYWEAEQNIPAPLETITLDWKILRKPEGKNTDSKIQILLVGAPINLVQKYQSILAKGKLQVNSIETDLLAVIKSIVGRSGFPTSLIIHMGAFTTSLAIIQNGIIVFAYSLPVGGVAINRAVAADFGFSVPQAEEYKKVYGIVDETFGGKIGKAIEPILLALLSEVKKAITFYSEKYKQESQISQILLTGGTAQLPGIGLFFVENVGIETVLANPWKINSVNNVPKEVMDKGAEYAVAIGLAMKEYE